MGYRNPTACLVAKNKSAAMASPTATGTREAASFIAKLSIDPSKTSSKKARNAKPKVVADSWEMRTCLRAPKMEETAGRQLLAWGVKEGTSAPPPTPISPNYHVPQSFPPVGAALEPIPDADGGSSPRRPDKTDAVARRMIASALGVKVPKQTEEQKAYDRALREGERKRRDEERAADKRKLEEDGEGQEGYLGRLRISRRRLRSARLEDSVGARATGSGQDFF